MLRTARRARAAKRERGAGRRRATFGGRRATFDRIRFGGIRVAVTGR